MGSGTIPDDMEGARAGSRGAQEIRTAPSINGGQEEFESSAGKHPYTIARSYLCSKRGRGKEKRDYLPQYITRRGQHWTVSWSTHHPEGDAGTRERLSYAAIERNCDLGLRPMNLGAHKIFRTSNFGRAVFTLLITTYEYPRRDCRSAAGRLSYG